MNNESTYQETLFADPLGLRFRHMREKARWSVDAVAQQLKLPTKVIEAIEREDWARLGAPIYVRSYVGSYAKLLGLPPELADDIVRNRPAPELVHASNGSGARQMLDRSARNLVYALMTVAIVGSVVMLVMHFQAQTKTAQVLPLDPPVVATEKRPSADDRATSIERAVPPANPVVSEIATTSAPATASLPVNESPVMASLAPSIPGTNPASNDLVLKFREESWLEVIDANGQRMERGLVAAGGERRFGAGQISRVTIGNAQVVDVFQSGRSIDTAPFRDANVARFSLSSQGNIASPGG